MFPITGAICPKIHFTMIARQVKTFRLRLTNQPQFYCFLHSVNIWVVRKGQCLNTVKSNRCTTDKCRKRNTCYSFNTYTQHYNFTNRKNTNWLQLHKHRRLSQTQQISNCTVKIWNLQTVFPVEVMIVIQNV